MGLTSKILELSPYLEVAVRRIYWSTPWLHALVNRRGTSPRKRSKTKAPTEQQIWDGIAAFLREHGVCPGSLLLVHSSGGALKRTGYSPAPIVDKLIEMVGPSGTLAMPAFPKYEGEPKGIDRVRADVSDLELVYDVQNSLPWTGVLPHRLMRRPGAVRSRHPLNSMVAIGNLARQMMENNLGGDRPLPCGQHSSWKFCADHGAVIVALGVDMAHSLTMIHVAEDAYEREWPVHDWYRDRRLRIVDDGAACNVVVRERHPRCAAHYAERTLSKDLKRHGIMASTCIDGILVEVLVAEELLRFLSARRSTAYPYFLISRDKKKKR